MKIRQAKLTDQGSISEMIYSSGPEIYDFIYKTDKNSALEFIEYEFKSGRGFSGYKNLTVAKIENQIVSTGSFYTGKDYNKLSLGSLMNMIIFFGFPKVLSIIKRTFPTINCMYKPKNDELYLSNFGVDKDMRGKGIGSKILNYKINQAKENGLASFNLDVALNNPRAERLYKNIGLNVISEKNFKGARYGMTTPSDCKHMQLIIKN